MRKARRVWLAMAAATLAPALLSAQAKVPEAMLADAPSYDSSRPGSRLPRIERIAGAVVLNDEIFAVAEGVEGAIYVVDAITGRVLVHLPAKPEPLEGPIRLLDRLPGGRLVAWRPQDGNTIKVYSVAGMLEDSIPWPHALRFGGPKPAGILPNRTLILRVSSGRSPIPGVPDVRGVAGSGIRYEVESAQGRVLVAAAKVTDQVTVTVPVGSGSTFGTARMIFGNQVLVARSGGQLVVAPTGASSASVYDRTGALAYTIPFPGTRTPVDEAQIAAQRHQRIADARESGSTSQHLDAISAAAEYMGKSYERVNTDSLIALQLPAKATAPPIDRILADPSGRIWFRLTAMPAATHTRWCVWDTSRREYVFWLTLPRQESLLGAFAGMVLLHGRTRDDQPRILVTPFTISGASERPLPTHSLCEEGQPYD